MDTLNRPSSLTRLGNWYINCARRAVEVAQELKPAYMIVLNESHYKARGRSAYIDIRRMDAAEIANVVRDIVYDDLIREITHEMR